MDSHPLHNSYKIVVPDGLKRHILELGHNRTGHFGVKKTLTHIQAHFTWKGICSEVATYCKQCEVCAMRGKHKKQVQPLQPVPVVHKPWSKLAIDVIGPFDRTAAGNKFALTIVDMATRYPVAIPLKKVDTASTADALLKVFSDFGTPETLVSDNGGNFTSTMMTELLKALGISQIRVAPYNPQANGMVERLNATIKEAIVKAGLSLIHI